MYKRLDLDKAANQDRQDTSGMDNNVYNASHQIVNVWVKADVHLAMITIIMTKKIQIVSLVLKAVKIVARIHYWHSMYVLYVFLATEI